MSTLAHMRLLFDVVSNGKLMSTGFDIRSDNDFESVDFVDPVNTAVFQWTNLEVRAWFPDEVRMRGASMYAYDVVSNVAGAEPPFKKELTLGPFAVTANVPGTRAGTCLPPNNALVCTLRTPISTRQTRGRMYLPPVAREDVDKIGVLSGTLAADIEADVTAWIGAVLADAPTGSTWEHVIVSLQSSNKATKVTDYEVRTRIDTQRRRLSRVVDVDS